jgi:hypothetical protein
MIKNVTQSEHERIVKWFPVTICKTHSTDKLEISDVGLSGNYDLKDCVFSTRRGKLEL